MIALDITPAEVESGRMTPEHLEAAVRAVQDDGLVVLNDVVDRAHLEILRERMFADVEQILARDDAPFNWNVGNVQQQPPPFPPYLFRDVVANDLVIAVTSAVLGPGVTNGFYSGNTAMPGETRQPVHFDTGQIDESETASPPFALVVNIPVVDMSPTNGSTEIWPGTHTYTGIKNPGGDITIPTDILEKQRRITPPVQPSIRLGGVLIRDMRLWHAGMPNHTDQPRPMIAMIHAADWWGGNETLVFPKGAEAYFEHPLLKTRAVFEDKPVDHIKHGGAYAYEK